MTGFATLASLRDDLFALGIAPGDTLFVQASMSALGRVVGGPRIVVQALLDAVGTDGLIGMPAFSDDATMPQVPQDMAGMDMTEIAAAVPGFDPDRSITSGMGVLAETFRTWPGTQRSLHPVVSICLNGRDAAALATPHPVPWGTGPDSPLGRLSQRPNARVLLIGIGWNRCTPLHTAEAMAETKRTKTRQCKHLGNWIETPDVADDLNRLFPQVGEAFEATGMVTTGRLGAATCTLARFDTLLPFARDHIDAANRASGDRH
ncbi:AAC(3) family N-acetyltransferase [Roseobacter sp. HKCCA0434]|uniref:aminoglycoside N(3)-acetyltransferase n=1 Tax=Roseobacter sp. HKCCA0434 TaxID=3079297 RepID=UPI002905A123|nr:AAC(3) family N-acetyltransferase [Roseobacter sp. HKCCA0434]